MKDSLVGKLETLVLRFEEITVLLTDPANAHAERLRALNQEYARLEPVAQTFRARCRILDDLAYADALLGDPDPAVREMARDEADRARQRLEDIEHALQIHLIPRDPDDDKNIYLEIRAGTGGAEAALFAGDLLRMYARYAEQRNWLGEVVSASPGELGGHKEVILRLAGDAVYSRLKFESGVHRVQRVPETETQGRIHTSACTVAILPEADDVTVEINPKDLKIDTYRASGAGGQHVNRTDSAIRITHLPTGTVVECQDERSQHKNRARAMSLLQARILSARQDQQQSELAASRKLQVGSGDRSERIRTYNFPQGRITDHRINLTLYKLQAALEGDLDPIINPLIHEHQAEQLARLGGD